MVRVDFPGFTMLKVQYNCRIFEIYSIILRVFKLAVDLRYRANMHNPKCDALPAHRLAAPLVSLLPPRESSFCAISILGSQLPKGTTFDKISMKVYIFLFFSKSFLQTFEVLLNEISAPNYCRNDF